MNTRSLPIDCSRTFSGCQGANLVSARVTKMRKRENLQVSMRDVVLMEVFHRLDELVKVVLDQVFWESR